MLFKKKNTTPEPDIRTPEGFERIYNAHVRDMYMIGYGHLKDKNTCQEIVHDIFRSLWERRETFNPKGPIEHYLKRAVKLKVIDHIRKQERESGHLELDCSLENYCGAENTTDDAIALMELQEKVNYLIDQLPCRCREVYRLSREKGLSIKEIASTLLISENTVKVHLTKALNLLKKELPQYIGHNFFSKKSPFD